MKSKIIKAKDIRAKSELKCIPNDMGYYKWFAKKKDLEKLLKPLNIKFSAVPPTAWEIKDGLYCIYVGIAKKSLRERLNWHVNETHTYSKIKSGRLSTLRQSISSVLFKDQSREKDTDDFIDKLTIHYYWDLGLSPIDIETLETYLINKKLHILNGAKNKHPNKSSELRSLRKTGKENAI